MDDKTTSLLNQPQDPLHDKGLMSHASYRLSFGVCQNSYLELSIFFTKESTFWTSIDNALRKFPIVNLNFQLVKRLLCPISDLRYFIEEELQNARTSFEEAHFNLVAALNNVEARKRFEFLEGVTGIMDAHLRYFQQGYQLLHQMEPFISEVLDYVQQSKGYDKEQISLFERMQEYKRQVYQESRMSSNGPYGSPCGDFVHPFSRISDEVVGVVMESAANGKVQII